MAFPLEENPRGKSALVIIWVLTSLSLVVVALRALVKVKTTRRLWWDDWLMVLAEFWALYHSIMSTISIRWGIGAHINLLTEDSRLNYSLRYSYFSFVGGFVSPMFGRLSFCVFLLSLVWRSKKIPRWPLYLFMVTQVVINAASVVLMYAQCGTHISALWDLDIPVLLTKCWKFSIQTYWGYAAGSFNVVTDLFLSVYPIVIVRFSSLQSKSQLGVVSLLCLSLIAMIAAIKKTLEAKAFIEYADFTWNLVEYLEWAAIEIHVVIIASSIPFLRPLFRRGGLARFDRHQAAANVRGNAQQYPLSTIDKKHSGANALSISSQDNILTPRAEQFAITRTVEVSVSYGVNQRSYAHAALVGLPVE